MSILFNFLWCCFKNFYALGTRSKCDISFAFIEQESSSSHEKSPPVGSNQFVNVIFNYNAAYVNTTMDSYVFISLLYIAVALLFASISCCVSVRTGESGPPCSSF